MNLASLKNCVPLITDGSTVNSINLPNNQEKCVSYMEFIPFTTTGSTSWYEYNNFKNILWYLLEPTPSFALPQTTELTMLSKDFTDLKDLRSNFKQNNIETLVRNKNQNLTIEPYNFDEWDMPSSEAESPHLKAHKQKLIPSKPSMPRENYTVLKHKGMYRCSECNRLFKTISNLKTHLDIHTGEKINEYDDYGDCFTQSSNLEVHKITHAALKPHTCPECGKYFSQSSHLTNHLRIHYRKYPYACDICKKQFITISYLNNHKNIHTGENQFTCLICEMSYRDKNTLKVHMKKHLEERPFKCRDCGKLFKSKLALKQHKDFHIQNGLYSCDKCQKYFKSSTFLKKHSLKMCSGPQSGKKRGHRKPYLNREFTLSSHGSQQISAEKEKVQNQTKKEGLVCIELLDDQGQVNYMLDQQVYQHKQIQIFSVPNTEPEFVVIHLQKNGVKDNEIQVLHIAQVSY